MVSKTASDKVLEWSVINICPFLLFKAGCRPLVFLLFEASTFRTKKQDLEIIAELVIVVLETKWKIIVISVLWWWYRLAGHLLSWWFVSMIPYNVYCVPAEASMPVSDCLSSVPPTHKRQPILQQALFSVWEHLCAACDTCTTNCP